MLAKFAVLLGLASPSGARSTMVGQLGSTNMRHLTATLLAIGILAQGTSCSRNAAPVGDDSELKNARQSLKEAERKLQDLTKTNEATIQLLAEAEQKLKAIEKPEKKPSPAKSPFAEF